METHIFVVSMIGKQRVVIQWLDNSGKKFYLFWHLEKNLKEGKIIIFLEIFLETVEVHSFLP